MSFVPEVLFIRQPLEASFPSLDLLESCLPSSQERDDHFNLCIFLHLPQSL